jgi:hypothetical protein
MAFLLCWKNIARGKPQQGDRCHRRAALALANCYEAGTV